MSVTMAPPGNFEPPRALNEVIPLLAAALVLAVVGFTTWFWLAEDVGLLALSPLYLAAALFCADMVLLSRRLHARSKDND